MPSHASLSSPSLPSTPRPLATPGHSLSALAVAAALAGLMSTNAQAQYDLFIDQLPRTINRPNPTTPPPIVYVDDDAPPGGDGLSWATAFNDLDRAMYLASIVQARQIRIATGTYRPRLAPYRLRVTTASQITLQPGQTDIVHFDRAPVIVGGLGGLSVPSNPDLFNTEFFPTIISGDVLDNDQPGNLPSRNDNATGFIDFEGRFRFSGDTVQLSGLTIASFGRALSQGDGALRLVDAHADVRASIIRDNFGRAGGAVGGLVSGVSVSLLNCQLLNNTATRGGAIAADSVTADQTEFIGNYAQTDGGAVLAGISAQFTHARFEDNTANDRGGAVAGLVSGVSVSLLNCQLLNNTATRGGAIAADSVTADQTEFIGNYAQTDGGAVLAGISAQFTNARFEDNTANGRGGAIGTPGGDLLVWASSSRFLNNTATHGGAVAARTITADRTEFTGNTARLDGGAVLTSFTASFTDSTLEANSASTGRGGAIIAGAVRAIASLIINNSASNGGAVSAADLEADLTLFAGNSAAAGAGAVAISPDRVDGGFAATSSRVDLRNTAFVANQGGTAAAIQLGGSSAGASFSRIVDVLVSNVTFADNLADGPNAADLVIDLPSAARSIITIDNAILSPGGTQPALASVRPPQFTPVLLIERSMVRGLADLAGPLGFEPLIAPDVFDADPVFRRPLAPEQPLSDWATADYTPGPRSPAIDAADDRYRPAQGLGNRPGRFVPRMTVLRNTTGVSDLGAFEAGIDVRPPCLADFTGDQRVNVFDIIAFFRAFSASSVDLNGDGVTDIFDVLEYFRLFDQGC